MMNKIITILILTFNFSFSQKILIPMDQTQIDHLKAYGIAYWTLKQGENIDWLLNFRGGSFMVNQNIIIERELKLRGVYYEYINATELSNIFVILEENNMDMVLLEKLPNIAVYSPPGKQPCIMKHSANSPLW